MQITNIIAIKKADKNSHLQSVTRSFELLEKVAIEKRTKYCKVRGTNVVEFLVPLNLLKKDRFSQVRKHDCDPNGISQLANEIALEGQERGICVRVYENKATGETFLHITWGNTTYRSLIKINDKPDNFVLEGHKPGYAWVNVFDKQISKMRLWQHRENNRHSYNRNASQDDNLEGFQKDVDDGILDMPGKPFSSLSDQDKKKVARSHIKKWYTKSLPHFSSFWRKFRAGNIEDFQTSSYTPEDIKKYCSRVGAFGMTDPQKEWKDYEIKEDKISGLFDFNGERIKVTPTSCSYASKGASFQHAWAALHVKSVAQKSIFVISVEGCNTLEELKSSRKKIISDIDEWNKSANGKMFVHEVYFVNQCTDTEVNGSKPWALIHKF